MAPSPSAPVNAGALRRVASYHSPLGSLPRYRHHAMLRLLILATGMVALAAPSLQAQQIAASPPPPCTRGCITVAFRDADIRDVIAQVAEFSGYSIVLGSGVSGSVTAQINNQRWDVALRAILQAYGLAGVELPSGIIRIDAMDELREREVLEPLVTRAFRINYVPVDELAATVGALLTERGRLSTNPSSNTLIVTDTANGIERIAALIGRG